MRFRNTSRVWGAHCSKYHWNGYCVDRVCVCVWYSCHKTQKITPFSLWKLIYNFWNFNKCWYVSNTLLLFLLGSPMRRCARTRHFRKKKIVYSRLFSVFSSLHLCYYLMCSWHKRKNVHTNELFRLDVVLNGMCQPLWYSFYCQSDCFHMPTLDRNWLFGDRALFCV